MDQNPLPRGSLQVRDRLGEDVRTVPELAQTAVAVEAQYPAHPAGAMITVEMPRIGRTADGTAAALGGHQLIELDAPARGRRRGALATCRGAPVGTPHDAPELGERAIAVTLRTVLQIRFP